MLDDLPGTLPDDKLNRVVKEIHAESTMLGVAMVSGRLRTIGYRVSRERVRSALRASDPLSVASRSMVGLSRRQPYSVAGPNSLWHLGKHTWCSHGACMHSYPNII